MNGRLIVAALALALTGTSSAFCATGQQAGTETKMDKMDVNKDGSVSRSEYDQHKNDMFTKYDRNNDGMLGQDEMRDMRNDMRAQQTQQSKKTAQDMSRQEGQERQGSMMR